MYGDNTFSTSQSGMLNASANSLSMSTETSVSSKPSVFDVARYILERLGEMSTMKLQKLCYYSQAWSLVWDDLPLFDEEFRAWANGPVCKELFKQTQGNFLVSAADEPGNSSNLTDSQKDTIEIVLQHYGDKNAQWLSQLSHMEEPWRKARVGLNPGEGSDNIISKESMAEYYSGLSNEG